MSTEEEYKELSAKLRYGLELAEQRLIEVFSIFESGYS